MTHLRDLKWKHIQSTGIFQLLGTISIGYVLRMVRCCYGPEPPVSELFRFVASDCASTCILQSPLSLSHYQIITCDIHFNQLYRDRRWICPQTRWSAPRWGECGQQLTGDTVNVKGEHKDRHTGHVVPRTERTFLETTERSILRCTEKVHMKELGLYRDDHQFGEACSPRWERAGITLTNRFRAGEGSSFFTYRHDGREIVWLVCEFSRFGAFDWLYLVKFGNWIFTYSLSSLWYAIPERLL